MHDRHDRIASLLKEHAARFILQEANSNPLITVTNVTISPDYRKATIFVTTIPEQKEQEALIFLKRYGTEFRQYIKKHAKLKFIPHVEFAIDHGERHRQHIDEIVRDVNNKESD